MSDDNSHSVDEIKMTIVPLIMIVFALKGMSMSQNIVLLLYAINSSNVDDEFESESSNEENLTSSQLKNMHWCICQNVPSCHHLLNQSVVEKLFHF